MCTLRRCHVSPPGPFAGSQSSPCLSSCAPLNKPCTLTQTHSRTINKVTNGFTVLLQNFSWPPSFAFPSVALLPSQPLPQAWNLGSRGFCTALRPCIQDLICDLLCQFWSSAICSLHRFLSLTFGFLHCRHGQGAANTSPGPRCPDREKATMVCFLPERGQDLGTQTQLKTSCGNEFE